MVAKDDTSKPRRGRNRNKPTATAQSSSSSSTDNPNSPPPPVLRSALEQAIEAERAQLLQAHAVLKCLYEVLLYGEDEDAVFHAEAAHVAARLIDESVERLDLVRLKPMIEALKRAGDYESSEEKIDPRSRRDDKVEEERAVYTH